MKPGVLLDATMLGRSLLGPTYRTGIFRVVHELLSQFAKVHNTHELPIEPAFIASDARLAALTQHYLEEHPPLTEIPFILEAYLSQHPSLKKQSLRHATLKVKKQAIKSGERPAHSLEKMVLQANLMLHGVRARRHKLSFNQVLQGHFNKAQAVHYLFCEQLQQTGHLLAPQTQRFVTIYDLTPIVCQVCGDSSPTYRQGQIEALRCLRPSDWVFCISHSCRNDLLAFLPQLNPDRVRVTHLAAQESCCPVTDKEKRAAVLQQYKVATDTPYFLSVCTLAPHKNVKTVISGFFAYLEANPDSQANLVLTGTKGWEYEELFSLLQAKPQYKERVIFTGYVADADLASLYSAALAFIYISLYEGFGLPILEAMQCGTPVISSNSSSMPEVGGDAVLYTKPLDTTLLLEHMRALENNPALRAQLREAGLAQAARFSWECCASETLSVYEEALRECKMPASV